MAQPFDDRRLRARRAKACPWPSSVGVYLDGAFFSASFNNILVYRTADPEFPITWFDRQGNVIGRVSAPGRYASVALSPDGTRAVASRTNPRDWANADLVAARPGARRQSDAIHILRQAMRADFPLWSSDGKRVALQVQRPGRVGIYQKLVELSAGPDAAAGCTEMGVVDADELVARRALPHVCGHRPDRRLGPVGRRAGREPGSRGRAECHLRATRFNEEEGRFSPDGDGSRTSRTNPAPTKCTSAGSTGMLTDGSASVGTAACWFRKAADRHPAGGAMARSSSISRRTA